MESLDQRPDADLEAGVPLVHALLRLGDTLDQLQQRMLTFHHNSHKPGRVHLRPQVGGRRR